MSVGGQDGLARRPQKYGTEVKQNCAIGTKRDSRNWIESCHMRTIVEINASADVCVEQETVRDGQVVGREKSSLGNQTR